MKRLSLIALALSLGLALSLQAQVVFYTGGILAENFDNMGASGTTTPPGWCVGWHDGYPPGMAGTVVRTNGLTVNNGTTAAAGAIAGFNCGTNDATAGLNRSLGTAPTSTTSPNGTNRFIEVAIQNDSGLTINAINVTYVGRQWRTGSSTAGQAYTNYLQCGTDGMNYVFLGASFDFRAPVLSPANTPLDGNLPANYRTNLGGIYGLPVLLAPGGTIYLRWLDANDPSTDPVLAIDNFTFAAATMQPVAIVAQPQDAVKTAGDSATFSVGANGVPISYQWLSNGVPVVGATSSNYTLAAVATNMSGSGFSVIVSNSLNSLTSRVATLTVFPSLSQTLVSLTNAIWRYNQSGADLGTAWKDAGYNDTAWPQGRGVLAWEDTAATLAVIRPITNTVLSLTNLAGQHIVTYYFRTTFVVTNPAETPVLTFSNLTDDGAIVYLNGVELYRLNMPNGAVTSTNQALAAATEGAFTANTLYVPNLVAGANLLAVEVHQYGTASSDVVMGLSLTAQPMDTGPVLILQSPQNQTVNPGGNTAFSVLASGHAPVSYQWCFNGVDLPNATNVLLPLNNVSMPDDGFYWLRLSNAYGAVTSPPVRLHVNASGCVAFYAANFDGAVGAEWSRNNTELTPTNQAQFLGQFANDTASLTLAGLVPHTNVSVAFDLFVIQTWNGNGNKGEAAPGPDWWTLNVAGGPVLLHTTFCWGNLGIQDFPDSFPNGNFPGQTGADETNSLGYWWGGIPMDLVYHLTYSFPHSASSLGVNFSGSNLQGIGDESWGLDNVKIYLDNGTVAGWPSINSQPTGQTATPGATASFAVAATGAAPLACQWRFNGVDIPGATGSTLTLTNVMLAWDGFYSVRVSNAYSSVTSDPARLTVDQQGLTLFYAADFEAAAGSEWSRTNRDLTPVGARDFLGQFTNENNLSFSLGSLPSHTNAVVSFDLFVIGHWDGSVVADWGPDVWSLRLTNGPVLLQTTFNNIPSWWVPATSAAGQAFPGSYPGDVYPILMGATETNSLGFITDKPPYYGVLDTVYRLTLSFSHVGDGLGLEFDSALPGAAVESWGLDNVKVYLDNGTVAGWPVIVTQPQSQIAPPRSKTVLSVSATGAALLSYQWFKDGVALVDGGRLTGATAATLTISNLATSDLGAYTVRVSNGYGAALSAAAILSNPLPEFSWGWPAGGTGNDAGCEVAVDPLGNCYLMARYEGLLALGITNLSSAGGADVLVAKLNSMGVLQWARSIGGTNDDSSPVFAAEARGGIAVDAAGHCFVTGTFRNTASFGATNLTAAGTGDADDVFVAKYDTAGSLLWVRQAGGTNNDSGNGIAVDSAGNCYVTGTFMDTASFGTQNVTSSSDEDIFLAKYSALGELRWVRAANGAAGSQASYGDQGRGLAVDQQGNCFITGTVLGPGSFLGTPIPYPFHVIFLAKYSTDGGFQWVRFAGGPNGGDTGYSAAADSSGNCYVAGIFQVSLTLDNTNLVSAGLYDGMVAKYAPDGTLQWVRQVGGTGQDRIFGLAVDRDDNCYAIGFFSSTISLDGITATNAGGEDVLILKYDRDGNLLGLKTIGSPSNDQGNGIAVDGAGNVFATGFISAGAVVGHTNLASSGGTDIFVVRFGSDELMAGPFRFDAAVSSLGVTNGWLNLRLTGASGQGPVLLEASADLRQWDAFATNTPLNGTVGFTIPIGVNPHLFFRAKQ